MAIRLPALIAGIATLPLSYVLARRLYNSTAALLTAALVASSSTLVEYSTNARGYSLLVALTIASLLAAARVIETGSQGAWATLALCSILGFYAIPTMAYAFGGVVGWIAGSQLLRGGSWRNVLVPLGWCVIAVAVGTALLQHPADESGAGCQHDWDEIQPNAREREHPLGRNHQRGPRDECDERRH